MAKKKAEQEAKEKAELDAYNFVLTGGVLLNCPQCEFKIPEPPKPKPVEVMVYKDHSDDE